MGQGDISVSLTTTNHVDSEQALLQAMQSIMHNPTNELGETNSLHSHAHPPRNVVADVAREISGLRRRSRALLASHVAAQHYEAQTHLSLDRSPQRPRRNSHTSHFNPAALAVKKKTCPLNKPILYLSADATPPPTPPPPPPPPP